MKRKNSKYLKENKGRLKNRTKNFEHIRMNSTKLLLYTCKLYN